ncbi:MAG TPA: SDR family NAD(P)-dependent oxidoreductase [Solirubrobacteraceae bacterium]
MESAGSTATAKGAAVVTGGAGFIGSHVVDALIADGREVVVIDDLSSGDAKRVNPKAKLEQLDIVDREAVSAAVAAAKPTAVYHLAAQASVVVSVEDPQRDLEVNVAGTLNVLDAAAAEGAPVVFTSTGGALYGDEAPLPTPEGLLPGPLSPYGASKWAAEAYVRTWSLRLGIPNAICRLGNVYGPRQSPHGEAGVVSIFTHHLHAGKTPKVYGHGKPTRDYVYVGDVVRALLAATGQRGIYNIATGVETDVITLWRELSKLAGSEIEPQLEDLRPGELQRSRLDIGLAERELGWRPEVGVAEGLKRTYEALVAEFEERERAAAS